MIPATNDVVGSADRHLAVSDFSEAPRSPGTPGGFGAFLWAVAIACFVPVACRAQEVPLETIRSSPTLTEILSVNQQGTMLGRREIVTPGVRDLGYFVRHDGRDLAVPIADSFTNVEACRLGNSGHVVGFALRPMGHPQGNQCGMLWKVGEAVPQLLPLPGGYRGSCAFDISDDGHWVSGYVVGRDPPRLQPCVWQRQGEAWTCHLLEVFDGYNPLLTSAHVVLSDDGRWLAASLVVRRDLAGQLHYGLYCWRRDAQDVWQRQPVRIERAVHLADINNDGLLVGRILEAGRRRAFVSHPETGNHILPLPTGRDSSYATGVNNRGQVVGVAEDPPGPEGTMHGFLWQGTEIEPIPLPPAMGAVASSANTITDRGQVGGMLIRQPAGGPTDSGSHTDSEQPSDAEPRTEIALEEAVIEGYVLQLTVPPLRPTP